MARPLSLMMNITLKSDQGFYSVFLRLSSTPRVSGLDMIYDQKFKAEDLLGLVFASCVDMARGVPMMIDMVDAQIKLDDNLVEQMIFGNIDRSIYERYFVVKENYKKVLGGKY